MAKKIVRVVGHKNPDTDSICAAIAYANLKSHTDDTTNMINTPMEEFEQWADNIVEGTWALPDNDEDVKALQELMSKPLLAGIDGENAAAALYDILGDDGLSDKMYEAGQGSPEIDVRPIVMSWLEDNMPDLAEKVDVNMDSAEEEPELDIPEPETALS